MYISLGKYKVYAINMVVSSPMVVTGQRVVRIKICIGRNSSTDGRPIMSVLATSSRLHKSIILYCLVVRTSESTIIIESTERHKSAARSRCRRAARVPATARACARWPVLPQLAASNRCRTATAAALTSHAPQRPHPHSILVGSWCTLLSSSPKSPCGLPTLFHYDVVWGSLQMSLYSTGYPRRDHDTFASLSTFLFLY